MIEAKPAQKIRNFRTYNKNVQVLNSSAIASGYAGRDPQGGFCDRSVHSFIEIVIKTKREFFSVFKVKKKKKKVIVKVKKKMKDEEGGKSKNDEKQLCTMKWRRKSWRSGW